METNAAHAEVGATKVDCKVDALRPVNSVRRKTLKTNLLGTIRDCCDVGRYLAHHRPLLPQTLIHLLDEPFYTLPHLIRRVVKLCRDPFCFLDERHISGCLGIWQLFGEDGFGFTMCGGFELIKIRLLSSYVVAKWTQWFARRIGRRR
jgi:hypothetical protein